ncbi:inducible T-cell costimulator [Arvicanthis niloticus]|uniref:inducible T-cell costimulator n=1 Tax=Arvicanthis niloticus TaxID=61156 RepID=UPI00148638BE|nr:inducible T-cell costimulator [Arvicanthis niloticus]
MKPYICFVFVFCFLIRLLTGEINGLANHRMFSFQNGGVQIFCEFPEIVKQLKMRLFKDKKLLCDVSKTKGSGNVASFNSQMFCSYQMSNNSVSFFLNNPDSSYYFCSLSIFDPPPFQEKNLSGGYLRVYESQLCCQLKLWLPVGCAAFAVVLLLGCILIIWFAKKKYGSSVHDPNSEYMFMAAVNTAKKSRHAGVTS